MVRLSDVCNARDAIARALLRTPMLTSRTLSERTGCTVHIKAEILQRTGSFKVRGALAKVARLREDPAVRGLVACSAGNHGQAVAFAASAARLPATIVMPERAPAAKVEACRGYGANVVLAGTIFDAFDRAVGICAEQSLSFVHPYEDIDVIAGQATLAMEILEDIPDVDAILVPVGGGGLLAGVAAVAASLRPAVRVIGVEPSGAAAVTAALHAGHPVRLDRVNTIADGLAAPATGPIVLEHVRRFVHSVVLVSDAEILDAISFLLQRCKLLAEPAGAAAVAALLCARVTLPAGSRVVVLVTGGNMDLTRLARFLAERT